MEESTAGAHRSAGASRLLGGSASLVVGLDAFVTTRFGLAIDGSAGPGRLTVGLDQPLVVERGVATPRPGSGYGRTSRSLVVADGRVDLSGERRIRLSPAYASSSPSRPLRLAAFHDATFGQTGALLALSAGR